MIDHYRAMAEQARAAGRQLADWLNGHFAAGYRSNQPGIDSLDLAPRQKLKALILQCLQRSIDRGWIDVKSFAYASFIAIDPLSCEFVVDWLLIRLEESGGILSTSDLEIAVAMIRILTRPNLLLRGKV